MNIAFRVHYKFNSTTGFAFKKHLFFNFFQTQDCAGTIHIADAICCSVEAVVRTDRLPGFEQVIDTRQHDGVHAEGDGAVDARIGAVGAKHVAHRGAAGGGR